MGIGFFCLLQVVARNESDIALYDCIWFRSLFYHLLILHTRHRSVLSSSMYGLRTRNGGKGQCWSGGRGACGCAHRSRRRFGQLTLPHLTLYLWESISFACTQLAVRKRLLDTPNASTIYIRPSGHDVSNLGLNQTAAISTGTCPILTSCQDIESLGQWCRALSPLPR